MKEMEAKTENRYEYRKPQEKRKQMIAPDLFECTGHFPKDSGV